MCTRDGEDWKQLEGMSAEISSWMNAESFDKFVLRGFDVTYCVWFTGNGLDGTLSHWYKVKAKVDSSKYVHMFLEKKRLDDYENFYIWCSIGDQNLFDQFACIYF